MSSRGDTWGWPRLLALLLVQLWFAHALVFFTHEFAHSFVAWATGWKTNPLALHYPPLSWKVLLVQLGVDQNVDEAAIFAAGHDKAAALVSAAGVLGNAFVTLPLGLLAFSAARLKRSAGWAMFAYWIVVASVGNLLDYVPVRTFTDGQDLLMDTYAVERGMGWSPWLLLLLAGLPSLLVLAWFFARMEPQSLQWLFPESRGRRLLYVVLTAFVMFGFYGAAGWSEGGPVSHTLSVLSLTVMFPLMAIVGWFVTERRAKPVAL